MSGQDWICLVWDWICLVNQDFKQRKSRSGSKTMNLGPDKLMTSKQDARDPKDINRATNCNQFTRIITRVRSNLNKNKLEQE
jgi:hypothetical protein